MAWLRSDHEAKVATAAAQEAQRSRKKKKKRSGNRKPKQANCNFLLVLYGLWIVPDHVPIRLTIYSHYTTTTLVDGYQLQLGLVLRAL